MKKSIRKNIEENALKSILILWNEALNIAIENPERARNYIKQIKAIKKHVKVKIPKEIRQGYCKNCFMPFIIGKTAIKRIVKGFIVITCLYCKEKRRFKIKN